MKRVLNVDYGLCECGCGEETTICQITDRSKRWVKGKPFRFKRGHATLGSKLATPGDWGYTLSEFELGWVAGLVEGEGSFSIKKSRRKNGLSCQPQLRVSMIDEDVIRRLASLIPVGNVFKAGRKTQGGKDVWIWSLTNSQALIDLMIALKLLTGGRRREKIDYILGHSGFVRYSDEE